MDKEPTRDLSYRPYESDDGQTPKTCIEACASAGYAYAGVQYSNQCFCGTFFGTYGTIDAVCDFPCAGDSSEFCGGFWANGIYLV